MHKLKTFFCKLLGLHEMTNMYVELNVLLECLYCGLRYEQSRFYENRIYYRDNDKIE